MIISNLYYFIFFLLAPCTDGDIQLYGSTSRAGLVRICVNGTWGKVCGGEQDKYFPSVVCSQLGFSSYGKLLVIINVLLLDFHLCCRSICRSRFMAG